MDGFAVAATLRKEGLGGRLLVALTGFELLVAFLQAYIFSMLTSLFIGLSLHPAH